jgi:hypothetical protein
MTRPDHSLDGKLGNGPSAHKGAAFDLTYPKK